MPNTSETTKFNILLIIFWLVTYMLLSTQSLYERKKGEKETFNLQTFI